MATQNPRMGNFADKADKEEGFYEQARERIGAVRPDESLLRSNSDKRRLANGRSLREIATALG